ncbi:hypothetical protein [Acinetobacter schindleri]|uniref:hypothetical protein n=1 Tax=Acinetobacter schindleri TaxID=108981 RepID=UPI00289A4559|nr:hypothetical protein [Acinetobacter schindleri]
MVTQNEAFQQAIRLYKAKTGETEVDLKKVAKYMVDHLGFKLPEPTDPFDVLAKKISIAAREEMRIDQNTGRSYRANHAIKQEGSQQSLWIDIDEAPRRLMHKSLIKRRDQIIGDALQLSLDLDHWNSINPHEEPIHIPLDFTEDVEERKNASIPMKANAENEKPI